MERGTYKTVGKTKLIEFFSSHPDCQFTAEEICKAVNHGSDSGISSVYRHLTELCKKDEVRKFQSPERGCCVYQYVETERDCRHHLHTKCKQCGKIEHLDCDGSLEFAEHLLTEHGFSIDCGQSVIYGICSDCRKKSKLVGGNKH